MRPGFEVVNPDALGAPRGYSNGILAPAGGRLLSIAGQIAWNDQQQIVSDAFGDQFDQALGNVIEVVHAAGGKTEHLIQLTIYVVDKHAYVASLKEIGAAYRARMGRHYPTMALVEVAGLLEPRAAVEIQALAVLPATGAD